MVYVDSVLGDNGQVFVMKWGERIPAFGLYVHPETRLLCYKERPRRSSVNKPNRRKFWKTLADCGINDDDHQNYRVVSEEIILVRKNGIWFIQNYTPYLPNDVLYTIWEYSITLKMSVEKPVYFSKVKYHHRLRLVSSFQMGKDLLRKYKKVIEKGPY
jgi:hypothetical protein